MNFFFCSQLLNQWRVIQTADNDDLVADEGNRGNDFRFLARQHFDILLKQDCRSLHEPVVPFVNINGSSDRKQKQWENSGLFFSLITYPVRESRMKEQITRIAKQQFIFHIKPVIKRLSEIQ